MFTGLLSGALLLLPAVGGAAGPDGRGGAPPSVSVEGFQIQVERIQQTANLALDFAPEGFGSPPQAGVTRTAQVTGRQGVQVVLAVRPARPDQVANIGGLSGPVTAMAAGSALKFTVYSAEENAAGGSVWRSHLSAAELPLLSRKVQTLRGVLEVFPRARRIPFDFPLKSKAPLPQVREAEGVRITLRQVQHRGRTVNLVFTQEWPDAVNVVNPSQDQPYGIQLRSVAGGQFAATGAGMQQAPRPGWTVRQCSATFSDVPELPDLARVELLVRSGAPRRLAFVLPDLELPDRGNPEPGPAEADPGPLSPDHPFFAAAGGTLVLLTPLVAGDPPVFRLGLARRGDRDWTGWRWLEVAADEAGRVVVPHLMPGDYRARLNRDARPQSGVLTSPITDLRITAGQVQTIRTAFPLGDGR